MKITDISVNVLLRLIHKHNKKNSDRFFFRIKTIVVNTVDPKRSYLE